MTRQERSLFDELLELAVYVPVGLASKALDQVPGLAEAGRARVGRQIDQARVIGRFAVGLARSRSGRLRRSTSPTRQGRRRRGDADRQQEPERPRPERPRPEPEPERPRPERPRPEPARQEAPARHASSAERRPAGGERPAPPQAIPDYDALSASQVVPRLRGLDREELAAVGRYEEATRHRRTILNRVAQLQREFGDR